MRTSADDDGTVAADPSHLEFPILTSPQNLVTTLQNPPAEADPTDTLLAVAARDLQTEMQMPCPTLDIQHQRVCPDDSSKMNIKLDTAAEMLHEGTTSDRIGDSSTGVKDKNADTVASDPLNSENQYYIAPQNQAVLPDGQEVETQTDQSDMPAQHSTSLTARQNVAISGYPPAEAESSSNLDMDAVRSLQPDIQPSSSMLDADSSQTVHEPETTPIHANLSSMPSLQSSDADTPSRSPPAVEEYPGMLGTQVEQDLHPDIAPSTSLSGVQLQAMFLDERSPIDCRSDRVTNLSEEGEAEYLTDATCNLATLPVSGEAETEDGQARVPAQEIRSPRAQHSLATSQLPVDDLQQPTLILSEEAERAGTLCATAAQDLQNGMQPSVTAQDARLDGTDLSGMPVTRSTTTLQSVEPSSDSQAEQAGTLGMLSAPDLQHEVQPSPQMQDQPAETEGAGTSGTIAAQNLQPETQSSTSVQHILPERTHPDERIQIGLQPSWTSGPEHYQLFTVPPAAVNNLSYSSEPLINEYEKLKLFKAEVCKQYDQQVCIFTSIYPCFLFTSDCTF
jgi:chromodomain-helicase-DNA-binding protein 4